MSAGKRDRLVTLQSYTTTTDDYGEEVQTWADLGTEWAQVLYGRGDERRQAAAEQGEQSATFRVLSNSITQALTVADRIVLDSVNWNIRSLAPDTPKRGQIEVTAMRAA